MVAKAVGRPAVPSRSTSDDEGAVESGLLENVIRQLDPVLKHLKNRWIVLGLLLIGYFPLSYTYVTSFRDYNALQDQISTKEANLAEPEPPTARLENDFRTWSAAFEAASSEQDLQLQDSELVERLITISVDNNVRLESLSTSTSVLVPVGDELYDATPILMRTTGPIAAIESFISVLEDGPVEALEIQNALVAPEENGFSGTVRALVFNRPVDPSLLEGDERQVPSRRVTDEELDAAAGGIRQ